MSELTRYLLFIFVTVFSHLETIPCYILVFRTNLFVLSSAPEVMWSIMASFRFYVVINISQ